MRKIFGEAIANRPKLLHYRHQSMLTEDGGWVIVGPMTHCGFKTAADSGDLTSLRNSIIGACRPRQGSLLIMKVVVHVNLTVSLLWHQRCDKVWRETDKEEPGDDM